MQDSPFQNATYCLEAGVNFPFRTAFRESPGAAEPAANRGRASRSGEYEGSEVSDFRHDESGFLSMDSPFAESWSSRLWTFVRKIKR